MFYHIGYFAFIFSFLYLTSFKISQNTLFLLMLLCLSIKGVWHAFKVLITKKFKKTQNTLFFFVMLCFFFFSIYNVIQALLRFFYWYLRSLKIMKTEVSRSIVLFHVFFFFFLAFWYLTRWKALKIFFFDNVDSFSI